MPLGEGEKDYLRKSGFIQREIDAYDQAKAPDGKPIYVNIGSETWKKAIESRQDWVNERRRDGWDDWRINTALEGYYLLGRGRNPFDFIRAEYKPPQRISDYQEARRRRAEQRIASGLRRYH